MKLTNGSAHDLGYVLHHDLLLYDFKACLDDSVRCLAGDVGTVTHHTLECFKPNCSSFLLYHKICLSKSIYNVIRKNLPDNSVNCHESCTKIVQNNDIACWRIERHSYLE